MPRAASHGIHLEYETHGPDAGPPVLLIMGIGQQMVSWPVEFLDALAQHGLRSIRYDSRDTGLSTHHDEFAPPPMLEVLARAGQGDLQAPYTLSDLAQDAIGLLDHLGLERAHVVGVSMGGMVAQLVAAEHPERTLSLTSIMSTTSEAHLPMATPEALSVLLQRPRSADRDAVVEHGVQARRTLSGPAYPTPDEYWANLTGVAFDRDYSPKGFARHLLAVTVSGNRKRVLPKIEAPTLVLHGEDDPLIRVECGRRTAELIPGARLEIIPGMGHDLAPALCPRLAESIAEHVRSV